MHIRPLLYIERTDQKVEEKGQADRQRGKHDAGDRQQEKKYGKRLSVRSGTADGLYGPICKTIIGKR